MILRYITTLCILLSPWLYSHSEFEKVIVFEDYKHGSVMDLKRNVSGDIVAGIQLLKIQNNQTVEATGLVTLDDNGTILSKTLLPLPNHYLRSLIPLTSGYLLTGTYKTGSKAFWVKNVDVEGKVLWEKRYGERTPKDFNKQWWIKSLHLTNGHYLLYGYSELHQYKSYLMMEIDDQGELIWKDWSSTVGYIRDVHEDASGHYIAKALKYMIPEGSWEHYLLKYNQHGKLLQKNFIPTKKLILSSSIRALNPNRIGMASELEEVEENSIIKSHLAIVDHNGTIISEKKYLLDACRSTNGEAALSLTQKGENIILISTCGQERIIKRTLNATGDLLNMTHKKVPIGTIKTWVHSDSFVLGGFLLEDETNRRLPYLLKY